MLVNNELEAIWKIRSYQLYGEKNRRRQHTDRMSLFPLRKTGMMQSLPKRLRICYADARDRSGIFGLSRYTHAVGRKCKCEGIGGTRWL